MNKVVAVEDNLTPVKNFLAAKGCRVVDIETAEKYKIDAVVLSDSDQNLMGMQDIVITAPVISARGKTPQQVWEDLSKMGSGY